MTGVQLLVFYFSYLVTHFPLRDYLDSEAGEQELIASVPRLEAVNYNGLFFERDLRQRKGVCALRIFHLAVGIEQHGGQILCVLLEQKEVVVL